MSIVGSVIGSLVESSIIDGAGAPALPWEPGGSMSDPYLLPAYSDPAWTFTRATEAAYSDFRSVAQGAFVGGSAAANWLGSGVPCIFSDGAVRVEGARTNSDTTSADFSGWTPTNATVTVNQADGPDASASAADLLEADSATTPKIVKATGKSAGALSASVWVKKATYAGNVTLAFSGGSTASQTVALTTSWQRVSISAASLSGATSVEIQLAADAAADCYVWGIDVEVGAFPTSDIRTAGAAGTRNRDLLQWASITAAIGAALARPAGYYVDVWPAFSSTDTTVDNPRVFDVGSGKLGLYRSTGTGVVWGVQQTGSVLATGPAFSRRDHMRLHVVSPNGGTMKLRVENLTTAQTGSEASGAGTGSTWTGQPLSIGSYSGGSSWDWHGVIGRPVAK